MNGTLNRLLALACFCCVVGLSKAPFAAEPAGGGKAAEPQGEMAPGTPMAPMTPRAPGAVEKAGPPTIKPGAAAPDFGGMDLAGKEVRLSNYTNKVVVLDFWATWCGPCLQSLPHTQKVAKRYQDQGVIVLAHCTGDTRRNFEKFVKANQAKYPDIVFACDPNEEGSATFGERASRKLYGVGGLPTQILIGRDGKVGAVLTGYEPEGKRLEEALGRLGIKP